MMNDSDQLSRLTPQVKSRVDVAIDPTPVFNNTQQKPLEQVQHESEQRMSSVLDSAIASIIRYHMYPDRHWRYTYVSPGCELLFGYSAADIMDNPLLWMSRVVPEDWETVFLPRFDDIFAGRTFSVEYRFRRKDESIRWIASNLVSTWDDRHHYWVVTAVDVDITERKHAELALGRSQQQYQTLINSVNGVVWEVDYETLVFTFVSPQAEQLLGYPCDAWLNDPTFWPSHIHPDDREQAVYFCVQETRKHKNHSFDYRMVAADGHIVWVRDIVNVTVEDGKPISLQGILIDITAEKQDQELLRHYERIVSATPDAIALVDKTYSYLVANQAYLIWHGHSIEDITGLSVADLCGEKLFQDILKPRLDEALAGQIVRFQDWFDFNGIGHQFVSVTYAPYFEEDGSIIGVAIVARDITGLKRAEVAMHRQAEHDQLLTTITNRIRQTLNLQSILDTTVAEVRHYLNVDRTLVYEFAEDMTGVVIAESIAEGYPSMWGRVVSDPCFTISRRDRVFSTEEHIHNVADIYTAGLSDCYVEMLAQFQVRANLVVPILHGKCVWGLLVAQHCAEPRFWHEDEIDLLKGLTDPLAIAIQQAQLYERVHTLNVTLESQVRDRTAALEQALEFESMLKRITDKVRDSLEEHHIFECVVKELAEGLNAYSCDTSIYDADRRLSYIQHEYIRTTMPSARGTIVLMEQFTEIYTQFLAGHSFQFCWLPKKNPIRSINNKVVCLACPVIDDQGVMGDIWVYRAANHPYQENEIQLVEQVANQCAIAIRQARLYEAAQTQVTELERLNRLKDDFLSTVSHELRTPMANIKMALQMVEIYLEKTNLLNDKTLPLGQYFSILKDECDRETKLINNLLDLTRLDSNSEPLVQTSIHLNVWVAHIADAFAERAESQRQQLLIHIPENIVIHTDLNYLERIVMELLNNACKYTPPGEQINVSVQLLSGQLSPSENQTGSIHPNRVQLIVRNSGVELPPEECDRIFQKFYRIPNSDPWKHGGTGLGLALVQKLAARIGATIKAESGHNEVRFILELPLL